MGTRCPMPRARRHTPSLFSSVSWLDLTLIIYHRLARRRLHHPNAVFLEERVAKVTTLDACSAGDILIAATVYAHWRSVRNCALGAPILAPARLQRATGES